MTELDLSRLYSLVGEHLEQLRACASDIQAEETFDHGRVKVLTGGVAGLYTMMESLIMIGEHSRMCCAYIDQEVVRYFSNRQDWIEQRPMEVEAWRARFADKEVVVEIFKLSDMA
jgi:hypothetical protein